MRIAEKRSSRTALIFIVCAQAGISPVQAQDPMVLAGSCPVLS